MERDWIWDGMGFVDVCIVDYSESFFFLGGRSEVFINQLVCTRSVYYAIVVVVVVCCAMKGVACVTPPRVLLRDLYFEINDKLKRFHLIT